MAPRSLPAELAVLTHLQSLDLRCRGLAACTLLDLAALTTLTRLRVIGERVRGSRPSALLAHLGALSGLTRLASLTVGVTVRSERDVMLAPGDLLRALPLSPSLATVRSRLEGCPHVHTPLLAAVWKLHMAYAPGSALLYSSVTLPGQNQHVHRRYCPARMARWRWGRWTWTAAPT
jgi:hypothetical protein